MCSSLASNICYFYLKHVYTASINTINNLFHSSWSESWMNVHTKAMQLFILYSPVFRYLYILFFKHIHTLLQSFNSLFHSFITLCENEYFLIPNLHCYLTNAALCPLVLLPRLYLKNIFLSISSLPFNILTSSTLSHLSLLFTSVVKPFWLHTRSRENISSLPVVEEIELIKQSPGNW